MGMPYALLREFGRFAAGFVSIYEQGYGQGAAGDCPFEPRGENGCIGYAMERLIHIWAVFENVALHFASGDADQRYESGCKVHKVHCRVPTAARGRLPSQLLSEVSFWDSLIASWTSEERRLARNVQIAPKLRRYFALPDVASPAAGSEKQILTIHLLVVGCGPTSDVGYVSWADTTTTLVLTDPLAKNFEDLLLRHGLTPPAQVIPVHAEHLLDIFQYSSFELVYSVNVFHEVEDPLAAFRSMLAITGDCMWTVVELWENEADRHFGLGMRQWNFKWFQGHVVMSRYGTDASRGFNLTGALHAAGADAVLSKRWQGCFLNGDCHRRQHWRLRLSMRKAPQTRLRRCGRVPSRLSAD